VPGNILEPDIRFDSCKYDQHYNISKNTMMANKEAFIQAIKSGYSFKGESVQIGAAILDGEVIAEAPVFTSAENNEQARVDCGCNRNGKNQNPSGDQ
jgi:hypothetical protein